MKGNQMVSILKKGEVLNRAAHERAFNDWSAKIIEVIYNFALSLIC